MSARFVFFGTGADFSMVVFEQLVELDQLPDAIVVPEYSPGPIQSTELIKFSASCTQNRLLKKAKALDLTIIYAPESAQSQLQDQLSAMVFDFILVACWPYRLNKHLCSLATKAALNLHPSLLPKFRGANPVDQQLASSDRDFGVSLHLLSDQFDAGDIVKQAGITMSGEVDRDKIERQAAIMGADLFFNAINDFGTDRWRLLKQT